MNAVRILLAVSRLQRGGLEQVLLDVASGLSARGFAFETVALTGPGLRDGDFRAAGIPVHVLGGSASLSPGSVPANLLCLNRLAGIMSRYRPDIVQTHHFFSGVLGRVTALALGVPVLVQAEHNFYLWKGGAARTVDRLLARATSGFVTPSAPVARHVAATHGVDPGRVTTIPNGLPPPNFLTRAMARERLGLPSGARVVGFVGRLAPAKRPEDFVRLAARFPGTLFVLVGSGPLDERCRRLAAELGAAVRLLGDVPDAASSMKAFDLLVSCSLEEGFGLAVAEALEADVPVVATDLKALRELMPWVAAEAFAAPGDVDALAREVSRLLSELTAAPSGRPELRRPRLRLGLAEMLDGYETFYRALISRSRQPVRAAARAWPDRHGT